MEARERDGLPVTTLEGTHPGEWHGTGLGAVMKRKTPPCSGLWVMAFEVIVMVWFCFFNHEHIVLL